MPSGEYQAPRPTYSKLFWKDMLAKTQGMSASGFGAYVRILGYMVTVSADYCSAPDDDAVLARVSGLGTKAWRRVRPEVIAQLSLTESGRLISRRLSEDADVWRYHCMAQWMRRTGGRPAVDPRLTGGQSAGDHARSREKPEARKRIESDSEPSASSGEANGHPPPVGGMGPVSIETGTPKTKPRMSDEEYFKSHPLIGRKP